MTAAAKPMRFLAVAVDTDRRNPETRRLEPVEPHAVLRVIHGAKENIATIELTHAQLAALLEQASGANARLLREVERRG